MPGQEPFINEFFVLGLHIVGFISLSPPCVPQSKLHFQWNKLYFGQ
jgi:hypothetical protein